MAISLRAIGANVTTLNVEAIAVSTVDTANESLLPGGGVCEAHSSRHGIRIGTGMSYARRTPNRRCEATKGYHLPTRYVIHAVGPACGVETTANWSSSFPAIAGALSLPTPTGLRPEPFQALVPVSTAIHSSSLPTRQPTRFVRLGQNVPPPEK
jgi:O-acetyl-ADP-ribose deacetylase (regulator of RNase III)